MTRCSRLTSSVAGGSLVLAMLFALPRCVHAQWATGGPAGGEVLALAGHSAAPNLMIAGTAHGAFVTNDGGMTWQDANAGLTGDAINGVALDAGGNAVAATSSGLFLRRANTDKWTAVGPPGSYTSMAVSRKGFFYAGSIRSGLLKSTDRGATWTSQALPGTPPVFKVAVDADEVEYAGTRQGVFVYADAAWKQTDLGTTSADITALSIALDQNGLLPASGTVYAGTSSGDVFVSKDKGQTWTKVSDAALSSAVSGVLATADGSVYMTNDSGAWLLNADTKVWGKIAHYSWARANGLLLLGANLYVATGNGVLLKGEEGWSLRNTGLLAHTIKALATAPNNVVFALTRGGIYRSEDGGANWKFSGFSRAQLESLAVGPTTSVYAGTRTGGNPVGVFKSVDGGQHWQVPANAGLPSEIVYALAVDGDGNVYAATQTGLFKSVDGAATWNESDNGPGAGAYLDLLILPGNTLLTCSRDGIFTSSDKAATWKPCNTGLASGHADTLSASADGSIIYAGSGPAIYKSVDKGSTWKGCGSPPESPGPMRVTAVSASVAYAGDRQTGLWKSVDAGATWTNAGTGLKTPQIFCLAVSPTGTLFVGTNGFSVWQKPAG